MMWKPPINFLTLHYTWILFCGILGLIIIYPYGNVAAVDAYFFGASASTESGLNTVDVKDLKTYQQLYIYFIPIITNLGFINIIVVAVRIYWFEKKLKTLGPSALKPSLRGISLSSGRDTDLEAQIEPKEPERTAEETDKDAQNNTAADAGRKTHIVFAPDAKTTRDTSSALYVPPPQERDNGQPIVERDRRDPVASGGGGDDDDDDDDDEDAIKPVKSQGDSSGLTRRRPFPNEGPSMSAARSIEKVASSMFIIGPSQSSERRKSDASHFPRPSELPSLSREVTIGRNSQFYNLTAADREKLGGIEYRALKLLLKIVLIYFFGLHILGVICLVPWIHNAPAKYTDWLAECGQDKTWWAFYSAQTMVNNLGFTLTPDSMASFKDATWPMLIMTFLAYAGNTCYPVVLRLCIWISYKLVPTKSSSKESLRFLLDHPRRCYTLLFPSRPTWILFGILFTLNFIDVLLIIVFDLNNPAVNDLPIGPRILSALFQAASSRHTGTSTLNLANVNPAVQFSLLVMMYIAILPIAISIRASNTYEEKTLGLYASEHALDEKKGTTYVLLHVRNQLSFDLWYIFLGTFCICAAEADRIVDTNDPAFSVFSVFFEVVSAYGNVGLSLGHPTVLTSLSGQFATFSKLVICAMMVRGRHRGLPYALDRAIMLPNDRSQEEEDRPHSQGASKSVNYNAPPNGSQLASTPGTLPVKADHTS